MDDDLYCPTNFVEANALLALTVGDEDSARAHLDGLFDSELESVAGAGHRLYTLARDILGGRGV